MSAREEILQDAHAAIKAREFEHARILLEQLPGDPTAQKWLAKLDEVAPQLPPTPPPPSTPEEQALMRAKDLIAAKRYDDARRILQAIDHDPVAQKWLAKLEEIAPPQASIAGDLGAMGFEEPLFPDEHPAPIRPLNTAQPAPSTLDLLLHSSYPVLVIAIILGAVLIALLFNFLADPWLQGPFPNGSSMQASGCDEITAVHIFIGECDNSFTVAVDSGVYDPQTSEDVGGLVRVRVVDRFLVVVPIMVGLIVIVFLRMLTEKAYLGSMMSIVAFAFVLLVFPFLWEIGSQASWENNLERRAIFDRTGQTAESLQTYNIAAFTDLYDTADFKVLAGAFFAISLLGLLFVGAVELGFLGSPALAQSGPDPGPPPKRRLVE
ncbi:MAG: hypothetical protein ACLFTK_14440 [Anaerolineales bacterium]